MRAALAEDADFRPRGPLGNDGVAAAALPVRFPAPLLEPLAVERLYLDNYFSIAKARRDLGYEPLFTTQQALTECLPYYVSLFEQMKNEARAEKTAATVKP